MFTSTIDNLDAVVSKINSDLNRFGEHLRNQAIRSGIVAAGQPLKATFAQLASRYRGKDPPERTIRGTNVRISRPHMADSITNKIWRSQSGNVTINFIGPVAIEIPHAHWFGPKAPTNRRTRDGQNRGTHLSNKGGPADLIGKTVSSSMEAAVNKFASVVKEKMDSFVP